MSLSPERKEITRRWRQKNRDRANEQNRAYCARYPGRRTEIQRRYRARYQDHSNARATLAYHIKKGHIVKGPCEDCGAAEVQGHHHDYTKPLEVTWLCAACHGKRHRAD